MENFEGAPRKVKEKNVFLLHLDTPRIIILSSAVIGVITVAFLLGMNFMTKKKVSDSGFSKSNNAIFNSDKGFSLNKGSSLLSEGDKSDKTDKTDKKEDNLSSNKDDITSNLDKGSDKKDTLKDKNKIVSKDVFDDLNNDNINTVYEGKKKKSSTVVKNKKSTKIKKHRHRERKRKYARKKRHHKKKRVVEVSYSSKKLRLKRYGYSVQVASYDKRSTAQRELRRLKRNQFDAYMYSTRVDGKRFYRVRIGPVSSKNRALSLLRRVQSNSRYKNSYLIKR